MIGEAGLRHVLPSFLTRVAALVFAVTFAHAAYSIAHFSTSADANDGKHRVKTTTSIVNIR